MVDPDRGRRVGPVDLDVHAGSLVALVGASGAGKSTLLDAVRCRVPLQRGHVELAGVDVTDLSRTARADALVWVPQLPDPVGSDVHAAVAAGSDRIDAAAVDEALAAVDLAGFAGRRPSELSGGERQRLAVARGVLRAGTAPGACVLLADEPTSHLDRHRAALVIAVLRRVAAGGCAVMVATHDPDLIGAADHVVRLDEGRPTPEGVLPPNLGLAEPDEVPSAPCQVSSYAWADGATTEVDRSPTATARPIDSGDDLAWVQQMARPVRWRLVAGRTLAVLTELCSIGLAATATWMLVRASTRTPFAELAVAAVAVRAFAIGKGLLRYSERLVSHDTTFRMLADIRGAVVTRLGRVAPAGVPGMERGDVMTRVVDDVDRLADQELRVMGPMTSGLSVGLLAVVASATVAPGFGVAYAVVVIIVAVALPAATRVLTAGAVRDQVSARAELAGATLELVEHGDELTTTGAAGTWVGRISNASTSIGCIDRRRGTRIGVLEGVAALAAPVLAAAIVVVDRSIGATVDGALLGAAVLVPFALIEVLAPLLHAGEQQASVQVAAARLRTVLDAADPVTEPADPEALATHPPLVLDDVTLRWPGAASPVLSGLDLRLEPGEL
ncbi:MAG: ATP-binding cassette domain-containing protein, partial [Microthrixaceae bacterium]|nr:ATP-binding cassette domain-containing protein [Microthrixaceae bacterium]